MNILISSIGTAPSVGFIKLIKQCKTEHKIIGTDINDYGYTAGSQLVDKYYKVPLYNDNHYIETLLGIIEDNNIEIFIPIHDFEIMEIAKNIKLFTKCNVIIPTLDQMHIIGDKYTCTRNLLEIGVDCPKIINIEEPVKKIVRKRVSFGSRGIQILEANEHNNELGEDVFIQEFIDGEEYTVDILNDAYGRPIYIIPRKRLEVKAGVATKIEVIYEPKLIEICSEILKRYNLPGFCNIQFIKDINNKFKFIEINPRFGGCSISTSLASENLVEIFLNLNNYNGNLQNNIKNVKWGAIITRYYGEMIYYAE